MIISLDTLFHDTVVLMGALPLAFSPSQQALNMAAGVAMPEVKTAGPSTGLLDKKEVSFETSIRPEDKVWGPISS